MSRQLRCSTFREASYQQALANELGTRLLQVHCHLDWGRLYRQSSSRKQVRTALSTTIALYRAMAMTSWLSQTEAALVQVEGR